MFKYKQSADEVIARKDEHFLHGKWIDCKSAILRQEIEQDPVLAAQLAAKKEGRRSPSPKKQSPPKRRNQAHKGPLLTVKEKRWPKKWYPSTFHLLRINNHHQIILTAAKILMITSMIIKRSNKAHTSLLVLINGTIDIMINNPILGAIATIPKERLTTGTGNRRCQYSRAIIRRSRS